MKRAREIGLMILTAAMIFFAWQNLESVEVDFLFWQFNAPLPVVVLFPLLIGLVLGAVGMALTGRRRRAAKAEKTAGALPPDEPLAAEAIKDEEGAAL